MHVVGMNVDRKALLPGGGFGQADGGERRHGVDRRRHAGVVGAVFRALHDIAADDVALIGRDRRELRRSRHRVAADMDERIGCRAKMAIHRDAAVGVFDIAGGKIQRIDISDTAGAVDDTIGLERVLGAVMGEDDAQAAVGGLDPLDADAVLTLMPMRSLSICRRATASASIAGSNCGSASRMVTSAPARA